MPNRILTAGLAACMATALTFSLSACSGGNSFPKETVQGFFTPLGAAAPAEKKVAVESAAADSIAAMYAEEQVAHAQAQQDGGTLDAVGKEVVVEGESVFLCAEGHDAKDASKEEYCSEYSNLVFDEQDKIVSFDVGGKPLDGRLALGDGSSVPIAKVGSVTHLSSYVTIAGYLVVVVEVASNADPLMISSYEATYLAEDGRPSSVTFSDAPNELKSGRVANVALSFPNVGLGGTLELKFMDENYNNYSVEVPTAK